MNRIDIRECRNESTEYCSEIDVDGKRIATVYSQFAEQIIVSSLADRHCEVWRSLRGRTPQRARGGSAAPDVTLKTWS